MGFDQIGRYEIRSELGRGGMATVYHAYDPRFERDVAIKILPREFLHDPTFRARFEREARAIAALEHPAIVPVYDYGEHGGQPYLVMRLMSGGSLADRIERDPMPLGEVVRIVEQVASALDMAHRGGVIHRDLKPGNVLFDRNENPYLSDFGIVKLTEATASLTGSGVVGTPAYIAPEMGQAGGVSSLVDVYALGVTVYQMLTGQLPYDAETPIGMLLAHASQPIPSVRRLRPDLPESIEAIVQRALAKEPASRYPSAGELAADLQAVVMGQPPRVPLETVELIEPTVIAHTPPPAAAIPPTSQMPYPGAVGGPTAVPAPTPVQQRRGMPVWGWALIGVLVACIVGGGIIGGAWLFASQSSGPVAPTPTEPPVVEPTGMIPTEVQPTVVPAEEPAQATPNEPTPIPPADTPEPTSTPRPTEISHPSQINVLWDVSHGPRVGSSGMYAPSDIYGGLVSVLSSSKIYVSEGGLGLSGYQVVVICATSAEDRAYTAGEAQTIYDFVQAGGGLVLLGERPGFTTHLDVVASRFGVSLGNSPSVGEATSFSAHAIFSGVGRIDFMEAGAIGAGSPAVVVGRGEGQAVVVVVEIGAGRVVVVGDSNLWDDRLISSADNAAFARNVFAWVGRMID